MAKKFVSSTEVLKTHPITKQDWDALSPAIRGATVGLIERGVRDAARSTPLAKLAVRIDSSKNWGGEQSGFQLTIRASDEYVGGIQVQSQEHDGHWSVRITKNHRGSHPLPVKTAKAPGEPLATLNVARLTEIVCELLRQVEDEYQADVEYRARDKKLDKYIKAMFPEAVELGTMCKTKDGVWFRNGSKLVMSKGRTITMVDTYLDNDGSFVTSVQIRLDKSICDTDPSSARMKINDIVERAGRMGL